MRSTIYKLCKQIHNLHLTESRDSFRTGDDRAWKVDSRAQALVGPGLDMPLFPQTIREWNALPPHIIESTSLNL